jgi:hypothetical protein
VNEIDYNDLHYRKVPELILKIITIFPHPLRGTMADGRSEDESVPVQGRRAHSAWQYFTNTEAPWREKSAPCKHCGVVVSYNKKNENVQRHLRHCAPFLDLIRR